MEDDDEFGDLYTDVLRPLSSPITLQTPAQLPSATQSVNRPFDLKLQKDEEDILYDSSSNNRSVTPLAPIQALDSDHNRPKNESIVSEFSYNSQGEDKREKDGAGISDDLASDLAKATVSRVTESSDVKPEAEEDRVFGDKHHKDKEVAVVASDYGGILIEKDENIDTEENPVIPGLSGYPMSISEPVYNQGDANLFRGIDDAGGEGDDWDSDSEDDLQIVLNDNNHGPMEMDRSKAVGSDEEDEDEDGDPLVIVADADPIHHQPMEEQEWGEDAAQAADGERKEAGEKSNGGVVAPKIGYSNHGYHPFHSQFKVSRCVYRVNRKPFSMGFMLTHRFRI